MELATQEPITPRSRDYVWRLCATALSFTLFGLGGLLLRLVVFPLLARYPGSADQQRSRARTLVSRLFRLFVQFMFRTGVLTYEIEGAERLGRPGQIVLANHPSLIDVVLLIGAMREANCVVKRELRTNVFTRGPVLAADYISNDGSLEMLEKAVDALRGGDSLIIFPEGTRTTPGTFPQFHRGASAIALRGARVVTPVVITVTPTTLTKSEPWYSIPLRRPHFHLRVGQDIDPQAFSKQTSAPIASRKLNEHLHHYFMRELAANDRPGT